MAKQRKQDGTTGNGDGSHPILASGGRSTAEALPQPPASIGNAPSGISLAEELSLWQTACFDLQSHGLRTAILATAGNEIVFMVSLPASIGRLGVKDGHVTLDGVPVSEAQ
jgi:hypothetical protein